MKEEPDGIVSLPFARREMADLRSSAAVQCACALVASCFTIWRNSRSKRWLKEANSDTKEKKVLSETQEVTWLLKVGVILVVCARASCF